MTYPQVINRICNDKRYMDFCKGFVKGDTYKDLYQEFIYKVLNEPEGKIMDLAAKGVNVFDYWAVRVIKREAPGVSPGASLRRSILSTWRLMAASSNEAPP